MGNGAQEENVKNPSPPERIEKPSVADLPPALKDVLSELTAPPFDKEEALRCARLLFPTSQEEDRHE